MTHLIRIDAAANMSRFYCAHIAPTLFGEWDLIREWGRIGQAGTVKVEHHGSEDEAARALQTLSKSKIKRGYAPLAQS